MRHRDVIDGLVSAYDESAAAERDRAGKPAWKLRERDEFAARLAESGARRLVELGAGTGQDSAFFAELGYAVVATDVSPAMIERCRAKGLDARLLDMTELELGFPPGSFDAAYAMNSLLHVPNADLPTVLRKVRDLLIPGGLCFLGMYGGKDREGILETDWHRPRRFFSSRTNEQLKAFAVEAGFEIVDFHAIETNPDRQEQFQSLTLRTSPADH